MTAPVPAGPPANPVPPAPPVPEPVRPVSAADRAWTDLAAQLTPAASMARIDTVTARAVTTITVIGLLLTGLGALGADQFAKDSDAASALAVAAVIVSSVAVACALAAQVLTISRRLNPADLEQVKAWYHRQFTVRAYATRAATILLILAALLAGATAATALLTAPAQASSTASAVSPRGEALPVALFQFGGELPGLGGHIGGVRSGVPEVVQSSARIGQRIADPAFILEKESDVVAGHPGVVEIAAGFIVVN